MAPARLLSLLHEIVVSQRLSSGSGVERVLREDAAATVLLAGVSLTLERLESAWDSTRRRFEEPGRVPTGLGGSVPGSRTPGGCGISSTLPRGGAGAEM